MKDLLSEKVLFVDDEPHLLAAIKRNLRKLFDVSTAVGGEEGLSVIKSQGPFAVVVSDMRMPEMDGSEFLSRVKEVSPQSIRIMFTGDAGQQTAVTAINKGDVFRFLNKPCETSTLKAAVLEGIKEYDRQAVQQQMLEKTVQSSIKMITEVLGLARPDVFGSASRLSRLCLEIAKGLGMSAIWKLRTACLLSQIGCLGMPDTILNKLAKRKPLDDEEMGIYYKNLLRSASTVSEIPHLEAVGQIIKFQLKYADGSGYPKDTIQNIPIESRIMRLALDLECMFEGRECNELASLLKSQRHKYEGVVYESALIYLKTLSKQESITVKVREITDTMILAEDVIDVHGVLLVCKGWALKENVRMYLRRALENKVIEDVIVVQIPKVHSNHLSNSGR